MPAWTKAQLSEPWPRPHDVQLKSPYFYDSAERTTGANNLDRHRPGNLVERDGGETNRRAGTYGMEGIEDASSVAQDTSYENENRCATSTLDWCEKLDRSDTFASVRDVKTASTK